MSDYYYLPTSTNTGTADMNTNAANFNPNRFTNGQRVSYGEFEAVIVRHYYEGMWEIRVPGGLTCVHQAELKDL